MHFIQKKDGSCTLHFDDKEIKIIKEKKQLHFTPELLKHFGNVLMRIVIEWNENLPKNLQESTDTNDSIRVIGGKIVDDKDNK